MLWSMTCIVRPDPGDVRELADLVSLAERYQDQLAER